MAERRLIPRGGFKPWQWDGDPLKLPPAAVRELRSDEWLADQTFADKVEAFNAGLAVGAAVANAAARRQPPQDP